MRLGSTILLATAVAKASDLLLPQKVIIVLAAGTEVLIHCHREVFKAHGLDIGKALL